MPMLLLSLTAAGGPMLLLAAALPDQETSKYTCTCTLRNFIYELTRHFGLDRFTLGLCDGATIGHDHIKKTSVVEAALIASGLERLLSARLRKVLVI